MVHPEPEDLETMEVFTMEKSLAHYQYYNFNGIEDNDRLYDFLGRVFTDDLYLAAGDAYDKSFQKELDDIKQQQAVSDIRIRKGIDGNPYISCNVYGEKQLSKRMSKVDAYYYKIETFYQLEIPIIKNIFSMRAKGETKILYKGG